MDGESAPSSLKVIAAADGFGAPLKDALLEYLRSKSDVEVEDLGLSSYFSAGEMVGKRVSSAAASSDPTHRTLGLCVCGTGVGVSIFANKFAGVYAAACESVDEAKNCRSINNSNVLTLGAKLTSPEQGKAILDAWLQTPFKSPCPANDGNPWPEEIQHFLDDSIAAMAKIPQKEEKTDTHGHDDGHGLNDGKDGHGHGCALCNLASHRTFDPIDIMPGGSMTIVRDDPTSAIVRFKAGSLEPAHHHTYGHDLIVIYGKKRVWNLTKNQAYELGPGDFLYTPAGDLHRVQYLTDTEFFIKWDGHWDMFLDEDLSQAAMAVEQNKDLK